MSRAHMTRRSRAGFTLVELLVAISIYGIILTIGVGFVASQNRLFRTGLDEMAALHNMRYALATLETDIPTLGTNVPTIQPSLVYADNDVIAFTGDYASNIANDVFSTYIDLGAPNGQVTAPSPRTITIPNSSVTWPDTLYLSSAGTRSPAELLVLWFEPDSTTSRTDDYVMYREINGRGAEPVARHLLRNGTDPFFSYVRRIDFASAPSALAAIPDTALPIHHTSTFHRVPADTAHSALADSIRAVQVSFQSSNGRSGEHERTIAATRMISMPNAGFSLLQTCGDEPILGDTLGAQLVDLGGGDYVSRLTWNAAVDETAGELDVARYVIYRQALPMTSDWGDPYLSIPAGFPSYQYDDPGITSGNTYVYAIAAQDCTPMLSTLELSSAVIVP